MTRQMKLIAFMQAQNCSNYAASWRHPEAVLDFGTKEYYQRIGRTLEAGKFHLAFFDDRLAMPDIYGGDYANTVRYGIRAAKLDPIVCALTMGLATEKLGIGVTYSTTYYEPFHVARLFASMDLLLNGRLAWNVVTSLNDSEAANFGAAGHLEHDLRYDRADEFMEVVTGHWGSWADDAIVQDRKQNLFADPEKVRRLDHKGRFFKSRGPFTVPRSAQGEPVIIQAGQSGRGQKFATQWGDLLFVVYPDLVVGKRSYAAMRAVLDAAGRTSTAIAPACNFIVGATKAEAEDKMALVESLAMDVDGLVLLSEVLNYDFASKPRDEPFTDDELKSISGLQGVRDRVTQLSGNKNPTTEDFLKFSKRGTIHEQMLFWGTPTDIADQMEEWFKAPACDGFVVAATHVPGTYEEFVKFVIPELQRRNLFHSDYEGRTLRENLGLARPLVRPSTAA